MRSPRHVAAVACLVPTLLGAPGARAQTLEVGDPAPPLAISETLKGEHIDELERGHVYVVEFWSSWCRACNEAAQVLGDLQEEFADRDVTVLGVNVLDRPEDARRSVDGADPYPKSGRPKRYTVAIEQKIEGADPRRTGRMTRSWLRATGQSALPRAVIVDREGRVAWIGHPIWPAGELRDYLVHVAEGRLDEAVAESLRDKWSTIARLADASSVRARSGDYEGALDAIDQILQIEPGTAPAYALSRFEILLNGLKETERAYAFAREAAAGPLADDAWNLNVIAWMIVDEKGVEPRDYELAADIAERACDLSGWQNPAILDTLAKVRFDAGDRERGLELQRKAVKHAAGTVWEAELTRRLERYERTMREAGR